MVHPARQDMSPFLTSLDARYRGPLMSFFLRRIGDRVEAEDLTQQTFIQLIKSASDAEVMQPEGLVFTVATNLLRERHRRHATRSRIAEGLPSVLASGFDEPTDPLSPERVMLGRETVSAVLIALEELGPKTREIFILFRLENMKQREIAALLGIGQSTVEKHVMRAVLHLSRRFAQEAR